MLNKTQAGKEDKEMNEITSFLPHLPSSHMPKIGSRGSEVPPDQLWKEEVCKWRGELVTLLWARVEVPSTGGSLDPWCGDWNWFWIFLQMHLFKCISFCVKSFRVCIFTEVLIKNSSKVHLYYCNNFSGNITLFCREGFPTIKWSMVL